MSKLIPNETPSGVIDGVNTVFTFVNNIDYITQLTLDGVEYTDFVVNTSNRKQITLVDAPLVSIFADYYPLSVSSDPSDECTFGSIKQKVWELTGQTSNATNFSNSIVSNEINMRGREIWKGRVASKLQQDKIYRAGDTSYREDTSNIRIKGGSALTAVLNLGDVVAEMDTTNLLPSGYVEIGGDVINYTSITSTQIEGVSGQNIEHFVGEKAIQLYETPADFEKPKSVYLIKSGQEARKVEIPYDPEEQYNVGYGIINKNNKKLLKINGLSSGALQNNDLVQVKYVKKYVNMVNDGDVCPFGEDYGIRVLAYIVAGGLGYDKSLLNSERLLNNAYGALTEMYGDYNDTVDVVTQTIRPKSYRFNSVRR